MIARALRQARALLTVRYAEMLEYRAELVLWMLAGSMPLILMGVWMKVAATRPLGLEPADFARYFLVLFLVRQATVVWVIWEFQEKVLTGTLSQRLLQPIDPVWNEVAKHVAERFARLPFVVVLVVLFFVLYPDARWVPRPGALVSALALTVAAFALRFCIQYTLSMMAFWTERAASIQSVWFHIYVLLSGMLAPLTMYPDNVRAIAELTPFPYLVYVPVAAALDHPAFPVDVPRAFVVMAAWAAGFVVLNRVLWRRGLRQYSGMGA